MCDNCWDLDRREFALKMEGCDGKLKPFLTEDELKARLEKKWTETSITSNVVIKDAVISPQSDQFEWTYYPRKGKKVSLKVKLV